ncbi:hypothetical protein BOTCAL_0035g00010 [Botryotinia calthae]|uniref:Uncharacterized protein n=1 Tax=Botryotinia calthae TaxID=38488 RepID=A0A4Y8DD33_9HELO|nr:hypothetical protein BOTCAL_0035g00010 [Botryotinia calthae]
MASTIHIGKLTLNFHEDFKLFGKGPLKSIKPKVKEQVDRMELVRHADAITQEKIITNNPTLHDKNNLTFKGRIERMEADIKELKRALEESTRSLEGWDRVLNQRVEMLERDNRKRYIGETVNMRNRLIQMTLHNVRLQWQKHDPEWMATARKERNHLAHETDLGAVMTLAHEDPEFFDFLFDTIYGVPKKEIKLLFDTEETGGNQVYKILDERGSAFHNHFANTCVKPFNAWLSAVRDLQDIKSASVNKSSSDHESSVRKQKAKIQKSIREWDAAFKEGQSKRDTCMNKANGFHSLTSIQWLLYKALSECEGD